MPQIFISQQYLICILSVYCFYIANTDFFYAAMPKATTLTPERAMRLNVN